MAQPTECNTPLAHPTTLIDAPLSLITTIREYFLQTLTATPFVRLSVSKINVLLTWAQVPEKSLLTNEEFVLTLTAGVVTLVGYYVLFGKRHGRKRKRLAEELRLAQKQVSKWWIGSKISSLIILFDSLRCLHQATCNCLFYWQRNAFNIPKNLNLREDRFEFLFPQSYKLSSISQ